MAGTAAQPSGGPKTVLFADHIEAKGMGEYVREFRFLEPVVLHSVQIVDRPKRPIPDQPSFEGRTFPDVRTMSLSVYASDRKSSSSTMSRMRAGDAPGTFLATEGMVVDAVTIRGEYLRLSVVIYGQALPPEAAGLEQVEMPGVAAHLRASSAFDADRLDLADIEVEDEELEGLPDASVDAGPRPEDGGLMHDKFWLPQGMASKVDTSFLPGPAKVAPHLVDKVWKKSVDREELFVLGELRADRAHRVNPITWEAPESSRGGTGSTSRKADILSLEVPRSELGTGRSFRTGRSSASNRLSTAGSLVSAPRSQTTSYLSHELKIERQQREAAEAEVAALRRQLHDSMAKSKTDRS
ncbi:unnamed protein product [Prorocentrum cordatum]|uniref:C2 NT-type domain-containing protein n=1 Tax=Prorocentrum cordatum TaxID=2364126 RepID=A0ABN9VTV2_9DINO|nr:unnamed protein product [Polarella glacialis]